MKKRHTVLAYFDRPDKFEGPHRGDQRADSNTSEGFPLGLRNLTKYTA